MTMRTNSSAWRCATSSWSINRRRRPRSAWRKTSWPTVRRIFFKGGLGRLVCFRMPGSRHDLAPAVSLQQSVDRRAGDLLASALSVGLLHLGNRQHAPGLPPAQASGTGGAVHRESAHRRSLRPPWPSASASRAP